MRPSPDVTRNERHLRALDEILVRLEEAPAAAYDRTARSLIRGHVDSSSDVLGWVRLLSTHERPAGRQLAARMLTRAFSVSPDQALRSLDVLVRDEQREVRRAAVTSAGRLLRRHFEPLLNQCRVWAEDPDPYVRYAAVVAAARAATPRHPEFAEPLLKLLGYLLEDRDPAVRRALGPSALGNALLKHYPRIAFEYLMQWSTSHDEQVLWNVAMAFSSPSANAIGKKALIILRKLALDPRKYVWRAVAAAVWRLGQSAPGLVASELARWHEDEDRTHVAQEALRHIRAP